jgi:hypothetical protein
MSRKLYQEIAARLIARENCRKTGNEEWYATHTARLIGLARKHLPRGSGIDDGSRLDVERSTQNRLVITFGYHHMTEGMYDGWTEHEAIVTPSLFHEIDIRITGRDRNGTKDYLHDVLRECLTQTLPDTTTRPMFVENDVAPLCATCGLSEREHDGREMHRFAGLRQR